MIAPGDWDRVRQLFHAALDLPPEARHAFVRQRAEDAAILQEVTSLLDAQPNAEGFLSRSADAGEVVATAARLSPGDKLGPFEIVDLVGAGGMGQVYRAHDTRLGRDVAIKVLSSVFAGTAHGRERFEREARAVSRLTHPHISVLHDIGSAVVSGADAPYLVMELVDGETLAARLRRGPLPVDQALTVAVEIASALVAAHAIGVVHRDLKPGNIMLTRAGAKLLDFGLARLRPTPFGSRPEPCPADDPLTSEGAIVGTLSYMAPEQVKGEEADARGDLFAFGAVLYEMLSGSRAFEAATQAELVAAILEHQPTPLATRQPVAPLALERVVATCLAKDPADRWQSSKDLLRELTWIRDDRVTRAAPATPVRRASPVALAVAAVLGLTILAVIASPWRSASIPERTSFPVYPPDGATFPRGTAEMAVSPDGRRLVFVALGADGTRRLWLRRFDAVDSRTIDGSEGASHPFWSPDGRSIAFFADGRLVRIADAGGLPQVLSPVRFGAAGGTWNSSGTILFGSPGEPLRRVADTGGVATPATKLDPARKERTHAWPVFLPDGRRFLYLAQSFEAGQAAVYEGSLDSTDVRRLFTAESNIGLDGGQVFSVSKGVLAAQAYDADRARVGGASITIAEQISQDTPLRSGGAFSVAAGVVAYRSASPDSRLIWFDRTGKEVGSFPGVADYHHPWLSPDEKRVAVEKTDPATGRHSIWILDLVRGTSSRLVLDPAGAHQPAWSPDGRQIWFSSNRLGGIDLYRTEADGTGSGDLVLSSTELAYIVTDWSHDGRVLLQIARGGQRDLAILPLSSPQKPERFLDSVAQELQGQFSPNLQWVAYTSDESGSPEVYLRRNPAADGKRRVSTHGGAQPRWRRDGRELFYLAPDGRLMVVDVNASSPAVTGPPRALFDTGITGSFLDRRNQYVVTRDGQRFLVNLSAEDKSSAPIIVMMHWASPAAK